MPVNPAEKFTVDEIAHFKHQFSLFDNEGDGQLGTGELGLVLRSMDQYLTDKELDETIKKVDADGSGQIDFDEFLQLLAQIKMDMSPEEMLEKCFAVFDKDHSGKLTPDELRYAMKEFGEPLPDDEVEEMIREIDIDGDGEIELAELKRVLLGMEA